MPPSLFIGLRTDNLLIIEKAIFELRVLSVESILFIIVSMLFYDCLFSSLSFIL